MAFAILWGWLSGAVGVVSGVPQILQLRRTRTSAGLSLLFWQLLLAIGVLWTLHGLLTHSALVTTPNALMTIVNVLVLAFIRRDRGLGWWRTYGLPLALVSTLFTVDAVIGALIFGMLITVPQVSSGLGQLRELVTRVDIRGVSLGFLVLGWILPSMWFFYGAMAHESAILISAGFTSIVALANVAWASLRRGGLVAARVRVSL